MVVEPLLMVTGTGCSEIDGTVTTATKTVVVSDFANPAGLVALTQKVVVELIGEVVKLAEVAPSMG